MIGFCSSRQGRDDLPDAEHSCGEALETIDGDHDRIKTRRHWVSHDVDWLTTTRRFPGEPRFPGLKAIAMVEATIERQASVTITRRHFLSFLPIDAKLINFSHHKHCQ